MTTGKQPRIKAVTATGPTTLRITWWWGEVSDVDLAGTLATGEYLKKLRDPDEFAKVKPLEYGWGAEWDCGLDMSPDTLHFFAMEQKPFTGDDFKKWQARLGVTVDEAAVMLGLTPRTLKKYRSRGASIPTPVAIACKALEKDPLTREAHFRPLRKPWPERKTAA